MLIDMPFVSKNQYIRKITATYYRVGRLWDRVRSTPEDYILNPPIIVNSIPKSGTHLVLQVARALPRVRYYGSFIAWAPSWRLKPRTQETINRMIREVCPGEVCGAHLYWSEGIRSALDARHSRMIFVIRHPAAILRSEALYIARVSRHHGARKYYDRFKTERDWFKLCLHGAPGGAEDYPSFRERLAPYMGWLKSDGISIVKYEDLQGEARREAIKSLISFARPNDVDALDELIDHCISHIHPERSHTFRSSSHDEWQLLLPNDIVSEVYAELGDIIAMLGYN